MRADRLLRLLALLQRHRQLSARELADRLEVSERTVLRDMEALSTAGVPVYATRGRHGGCALVEGFRTDASGLTPGEAQALLAWSGRAGIADLGLGPELGGALAKVAATMSSRAASEADELGAVLLSDRRHWFAEAERVPDLPRLREAAVAGRRVRITYQGRGEAEPHERTVDPLGLVDQSGRWYLVATRDGEPRTYRVSRISGVVILDEPIAPRDGRTLAEVWEERRRSFGPGPDDRVVIELRVAPEVASAFLAVAGAQAAGEPPRPVGAPGDLRWRVAVRARRAALALVLAWAPEVELLAPDDVLEDVRAALGALNGIYARTGSGFDPTPA